MESRAFYSQLLIDALFSFNYALENDVKMFVLTDWV